MVNNNNYLYFARNTTKGIEVGIFPPRPDYKNKPITVRLDKDSDCIKFLESIVSTSGDYPTISMKYTTLTEDNLEELKNRLQGKTIRPLNLESQECAMEIINVIEDKFGVVAESTIHEDSIKISGTDSGIRVPDNYSAKAICTVFYELNDELYSPTAMFKNRQQFKEDNLTTEKLDKVEQTIPVSVVSGFEKAKSITGSTLTTQGTSTP